MTDNNGKTLIRMDLWAVLAFLVLLIGIGMGYLFNAQASNKEERQKVDQIIIERVTKLETKFDYVVSGITELQQGQRELVRALQKGNR